MMTESAIAGAVITPLLTVAILIVVAGIAYWYFIDRGFSIGGLKL